MNELTKYEDFYLSQIDSLRIKLDNLLAYLPFVINTRSGMMGSEYHINDISLCVKTFEAELVNILSAPVAAIYICKITRQPHWFFFSKEARHKLAAFRNYLSAADQADRIWTIPKKDNDVRIRFEYE